MFTTIVSIVDLILVGPIVGALGIPARRIYKKFVLKEDPISLLAKSLNLRYFPVKASLKVNLCSNL